MEVIQTYCLASLFVLRLVIIYIDTYQVSSFRLGGGGGGGGGALAIDYSYRHPVNK